MRLLKDKIVSLGSAFGIGMEKLTPSKAQDIIRGSLDFSGLDLSGQNFERLFGGHPAFYNCFFNDIVAEKINCANFEFSISEFLKARLKGATFSHCNFSSTNFANSIMDEATLSSSHFDRCSFVGVDLRHAQITNSTFNCCDFRGAKLQGAYFKGSAQTRCVYDPCWRIKNGLMVKAT